MFSTRSSTLALVAAFVAVLALATPVSGHQTVSSRGASVTLHVTPDDEPTAGQPSTIRVVRVKVPKKATFHLSRARLKVFDSSGSLLLSRVPAKRNSFTFPRAAAYQIVFSGSYRRSGKTRRFTTKFAIRAIPS